VPTDFLLLAVRRAMAAPGSRLKLVVMSATIDPAGFRDYFRSAGLSCSVVSVGGGTLFPRHCAAQHSTAQHIITMATEDFSFDAESPKPTAVTPVAAEYEAVPVATEVEPVTAAEEQTVYTAGDTAEQPPVKAEEAPADISFTVKVGILKFTITYTMKITLSRNR
jgi:hypothetical protein